MNKILITTAWSPTHSNCFEEYSAGINKQDIRDLVIEIFITTHYAKNKFDSIVGAMYKAEKYALSKNFTHLFNIEADKALLDTNIIKEMLFENKDIVLGFSKNEHLELPSNIRYNHKYDKLGWGVMLVKTTVLEDISFAYGLSGNNYIWPDRLWLKKCLIEDKNIIIKALNFKTLKTPSKIVEESFAPELYE